jgi:hypothetical protein
MDCRKINDTAALHNFSEISFRKNVSRASEKRGTVASPAPSTKSRRYADISDGLLFVTNQKVRTRMSLKALNCGYLSSTFWQVSPAVGGCALPMRSAPSHGSPARRACREGGGSTKPFSNRCETVRKRSPAKR